MKTGYILATFKIHEIPAVYGNALNGFLFVIRLVLLDVNQNPILP